MKLFTFIRNKKSPLFVTILLSVLFISAASRISYYIFKAVTVDVQWVNFSEEQKRVKYYGDEYTFFKKISELSPDSFYLIANDGKAYFLGRYIIYPKKLYIPSELHDISLADRAKYVLVFKNPSRISQIKNMGYRVVMEISNSTGAYIGTVLEKI